MGGGEGEVPHPSAQVGRCHTYFQDTYTALYVGDVPVGLSSCAYLHNYPHDPQDVIFAPRFEEAIRCEVTPGN